MYTEKIGMHKVFIHWQYFTRKRSVFAVSGYKIHCILQMEKFILSHEETQTVIKAIPFSTMHVTYAQEQTKVMSNIKKVTTLISDVQFDWEHMCLKFMRKYFWGIINYFSQDISDLQGKV